MKDLQTSDPKAHSENIRSGLNKIVDHLRKDVTRVDEPKAQALFETSAEVLLGLIKAFKDFEAAKEEAWK